MTGRLAACFFDASIEWLDIPSRSNTVPLAEVLRNPPIALNMISSLNYSASRPMMSCDVRFSSLYRGAYDPSDVIQSVYCTYILIILDPDLHLTPETTHILCESSSDESSPTHACFEHRGPGPWQLRALTPGAAGVGAARSSRVERCGSPKQQVPCHSKAPWVWPKRL